jgi:hypothetical protein
VARHVREPFDLTIGVEVATLGLFEDGDSEGVARPSFRRSQQGQRLVFVHSVGRHNIDNARLAFREGPGLVERHSRDAGGALQRRGVLDQDVVSGAPTARITR